MIEFKITSTIDKNQQLSYQHWGKVLVVGSLLGDMVIDDPNIGEQQFKLSLESGKAILENLYPRVEIRVNGKAISGKAEIHVRDNINIGKTSLSFTKLDDKPAEKPEAFEHPNAGARVANDTKEKAILDALEYLAGNSSAGAPKATGGAPPPPVPKTPGPPPFRK